MHVKLQFECLVHLSVKTSICQTHQIFLVKKGNDVYCGIITSMLQQLVIKCYSQKELVVWALYPKPWSQLIMLIN